MYRSWPFWSTELVLAPLHGICHCNYQLHGASLIVLAYPTQICLQFYTWCCKISLAIITDLPLIWMLLTAHGFARRRMVYLTNLHSSILISLRTLIDVWYQSVGRKILNPSTLNQSILFWIIKLRMGLMIHFRLLAISMLLIPSKTPMIS